MMARQWVLILIAGVSSLMTLPALCAPPCVVLDPELQSGYEGGCSEGYAQGHGVARGPNAEYRGEFLAGRKHGTGSRVWLDSGDRYDGGFVADRRHGHGRYAWGPRSPWAGERYEGEYQADKRHGIGTYIWSSGDSYTGSWKEDLQIGPRTPMQQQRARASKGALAVIGKPGTIVCGATPIGVVHRQAVQAEVREVLLRVTAVDGKPAGRADAHFWDVVFNWRPCSN